MSDTNNWFIHSRLLTEAEGTDLLPAWIIFDAANRRFTMSPTPENLKHTYVIKVIVRNSMLEFSDNFSVEVEISASYALSILMSVLGTFLSVLGLWVYRIQIYAILGKSYYCYREYDQIIINAKYTKNIYLIQEDLDICLAIWGRLKKNHKDVLSIYNSPQREQLLTDAINEAATQLKSETILDKNKELDD